MNVIKTPLRNDRLQSSDETSKHLKVIKRGMVVNGVMPVDEWLRILPVVILLAVPPMWPNGSNPVHLCVRSASKGSVSLPTELSFQGSDSGSPVLGIFDFHNKNSSESDGGCRQLHDLDDEVGNMALGIIRKATLRSDYVALGRRKEGCEDGCPWTVPYVLDDRWVCGVVVQHSPGDHVEGHIFLSNSHKLALLIIVLGYGPKYTAGV